MAKAELDLAAPPCVHLVSAFLAMEPLDCLISLARVCGGGSVTEGVQRFIWDNCISKADGNFHAPYMKRFLKKLIVEVESTSADVLDELYEQYAIYMTSLKDDESAKGSSRVLKWVSFLFPDDFPGAATCLRSRKMVISLQCSLNMLEGDTGCSIWPSSLFLSEFILSCPEIFSGKSCFEVGSGVGLVGICLAHVRASKVILSDGDLSSLANMKLNLGMNELSVRSDLLEANTCEKILVQCKYLPWESAPESELQDIMPDIVSSRRSSQSSEQKDDVLKGQSSVPMTRDKGSGVYRLLRQASIKWWPKFNDDSVKDISVPVEPHFDGLDDFEASQKKIKSALKGIARSDILEFLKTHGEKAFMSDSDDDASASDPFGGNCSQTQ